MDDRTKTTNLDEIKLWAQAHGATPKTLDYDDAGTDEFILRLDFPGKKDDIYLSETPKERKITWEQFGEILNQKQLTFEYIKNYQGNDPDTAYRFIKNT